ncbi:alpha/beta fold hydrolase [Thermocatellispora tengchongensis]|uniref:alpha/beta fold hydrolase n=1 Tax=Thermocatellispora tengchongensis TaxID=1073253 RepID=UPI003636F8D1
MGAGDRVIPVRHAYVAHAAMPGSVLEVFDRAGHFPHRDDPERFAKLVESFIETTAAAEYDPEKWRAHLRAGRPGDGGPSSGS